MLQMLIVLAGMGSASANGTVLLHSTQQFDADNALAKAHQCAQANDEEVGVAACASAVSLGLLRGAEPWPVSERFYRRLATALERADEWREIVRVYRRAIHHVPASSVLYFALGAELENRYDATAEAMGCFMEAVRLNEDWAEAHVRLGFAQLRLKRFSEARASFKRAVALTPRDRLAQTGLGQVAAALGQRQTAVRMFRALLEEKPDDGFVLLHLGDSLLVLGRPEQALEIFHKLLAVEPSLVREAQCGVARAYTALGRIKEAIEACRKATNQAPAAGTDSCGCSVL